LAVLSIAGDTFQNRIASGKTKSSQGWCLKMTREALWAYLHNEPLMAVIKAKSAIGETRKSLCEALRIMEETNVSKEACLEVQAKIGEYGSISRGYGIMLEDTFKVTWQAEAVIRKYLDCAYSEIDMLPAKPTF